MKFRRTTDPVGGTGTTPAAQAGEKTQKRKKSCAGKFSWLRTLLLHTLGVLLVVLSLTLIFRDYIAKIAFPALASWYLGVEVVFDDIDTTIDGRMTVYNLRVANPDGYSAENVIEASELHIDIKLATLFGDELVLEKVTAENMLIIPEFNRDGKFNFAELNEALQKHFADENSSASGSLRIDHLKCNGRITVIAAPVEIPLHTDFAFEKNDLLIAGSKEAFIEKFALQNYVAKSILPPLLSWALGLKTTFADVEVSLDGKMVLHDLKIANCPGFECPEFMRVRRIVLEVVPDRLENGRPIVKKLEFSDAQLAMEFNREKQFNMVLLGDSLVRRFPGAEVRNPTGKTWAMENVSANCKLIIKTPKISGMQLDVNIPSRQVQFVDDGVTWAEEFRNYALDIEKKLQVFTPADILKLAAQQIGDVINTFFFPQFLFPRENNTPDK